jgi:hypothetical protein
MGTIECPNHGGHWDCTPFCRICGGDQEYSTPDGELVEVDALAVRWRVDGSAIAAAIVSDGRAGGAYAYAVEYSDAIGRDVSRLFREHLAATGRRVDSVIPGRFAATLAVLTTTEPWARYLAHDGATGRPLFVRAVRS